MPVCLCLTEWAWSLLSRPVSWAWARSRAHKPGVHFAGGYGHCVGALGSSCVASFSVGASICVLLGRIQACT